MLQITTLYEYFMFVGQHDLTRGSSRVTIPDAGQPRNNRRVVLEPCRVRARVIAAQIAKRTSAMASARNSRTRKARTPVTADVAFPHWAGRHPGRTNHRLGGRH
jgi:hypothetical protein